MLILTRRTNESITCTMPDGQQIKVTITDIRGNQAKIGIDAPDDVTITREELKISHE